MTAPTAEKLQDITAGIIDRIYAGGQAKHGAHVWYEEETIRHHTDRAIRHLATAMIRWDRNEKNHDNEDETDHLERALVRTLFALVKIKHGHE